MERPHLKPASKTAPNKSTLPLIKTPDTGSLTPTEGMDSSVITKIQDIHALIRTSVESLYVEILQILGTDPNFEKHPDNELIDRTIYTVHKDTQIVVDELRRLGIDKDILEKARRQFEANKPIDLKTTERK